MCFKNCVNKHRFFGRHSLRTYARNFTKFCIYLLFDITWWLLDFDAFSLTGNIIVTLFVEWSESTHFGGFYCMESHKILHTRDIFITFTIITVRYNINTISEYIAEKRKMLWYFQHNFCDNEALAFFDGFTRSLICKILIISFYIHSIIHSICMYVAQKAALLCFFS